MMIRVKCGGNGIHAGATQWPETTGAYWRTASILGRTVYAPVILPCYFFFVITSIVIMYEHDKIERTLTLLDGTEVEETFILPWFSNIDYFSEAAIAHSKFQNCSNVESHPTKPQRVRFDSPDFSTFFTLVIERDEWMVFLRPPYKPRIKEFTFGSEFENGYTVEDPKSTGVGTGYGRGQSAIEALKEAIKDWNERGWYKIREQKKAKI